MGELNVWVLQEQPNEFLAGIPSRTGDSNS